MSVHPTLRVMLFSEQKAPIIVMGFWGILHMSHQILHAKLDAQTTYMIFVPENFKFCSE